MSPSGLLIKSQFCITEYHSNIITVLYHSNKITVSQTQINYTNICQQFHTDTGELTQLYVNILILT